MGRAIIATNHGGAMETIIDGQTGWLVPPGDADAMAAAINHALSLDAETRSIMASHAMNHIADNFTRGKMVDQTMNVYAELLSEKFNVPKTAKETNLMRQAAE